MPEEIMLNCQRCGEGFAIRLGQTTSFHCPACESRTTSDRVQLAMSRVRNNHAGEGALGLLEALIPFCSVGGLVLIAAGGYLALKDDANLVGGVCWIALGVLNLIAAQAGAVVLAIERRTRMKNVRDSEMRHRDQRSRRRSRRSRRASADDAPASIPT